MWYIHSSLREANVKIDQYRRVEIWWNLSIMNENLHCLPVLCHGVLTKLLCLTLRPMFIEEVQWIYWVVLRYTRTLSRSNNRQKRVVIWWILKLKWHSAIWKLFYTRSAAEVIRPCWVGLPCGTPRALFRDIVKIKRLDNLFRILVCTWAALTWASLKMVSRFRLSFW